MKEFNQNSEIKCIIHTLSWRELDDESLKLWMYGRMRVWMCEFGDKLDLGSCARRIGEDGVQKKRKHPLNRQFRVTASSTSTIANTPATAARVVKKVALHRVTAARTATAAA